MSNARSIGEVDGGAGLPTPCSGPPGPKGPYHGVITMNDLRDHVTDLPDQRSRSASGCDGESLAIGHGIAHRPASGQSAHLNHRSQGAKGSKARRCIGSIVREF
jgi:hypothetical protein